MRTRVLIALMALSVVVSSCRRVQKQQETPASGTEVNTDDYTSDKENEQTIDFTMTSMDGTEQSVSTLAAKHRITIIDFWASWCGPCRQEMPQLVELYNAYKDKGLGVIGVSLDEERTAWESAVSSFGMQWPQLSDLQGWDNAAAVKYGVDGIPYTIIVDSKCNVIATGLRGERLARFIEQKLGQ